MTANCLIVANWALGGANLGDRMLEIAAEDPATAFHLVVPVTPPTHGWTYTDSQAVADAEERLAMMLEFSERLGLTVTGGVYGRVANTDPVEAAEAALAVKAFTRVVVSTFPTGVSRWFKLDTVSRIENRTDLPVEHVECNPPKDPAEARKSFEAWVKTHRQT